jgi:kynureninase
MGPMRYAKDVWRMIGGTMPVPAMYTARAGWETVARLGVERIRAKSLRQTRLLRDLVQARGFTVNTPQDDARRGGTVCFDFAGADTISRELVRRRFFHDYRPLCGLRVSPHFYTTDDELRAFVDALDDVRKNPPADGARASY